jgi:hypothetical protein
MAKPPDIPTELLYEVMSGIPPVPAYGLVNIITNCLRKNKVGAPPPEKLEPWSYLGASAWAHNETRIKTALNEFMTAFMPIWIKHNARINKGRNNLARARQVYQTIKLTQNKKKNPVIVEDSHRIEIGQISDYESYAMPDTIDAKARKTALLRKKKCEDLPDFSD